MRTLPRVVDPSRGDPLMRQEPCVRRQSGPPVQRHQHISTVSAFVSALACLLALAGCGGGDEAPTTGAEPAGDERVNGLTEEEAAMVLATVGDREITAGELAARLAAEGRYTRARFASPERRREYLDKMIDVALLAAEARRLGYDEDPMVVSARNQALREEMLRELVDTQVQRSDVSDEDIAAYYAAHRDDYNQPAQVRAAHIVVRSEALARRLLAQVAGQREIAPFRALAAANNVDDTRARGGDLLFFGESGEPGPPAAVRAAAFGLSRIGDVHDEVIETDEGFHIVKLTGRRAALQRSVQDVSGPIRNAIWSERRAAARDALIEELREGAEVEEHLDVLDDVHIELPEAPSTPGAGAP